jgi:hypothetical protein
METSKPDFETGVVISVQSLDAGDCAWFSWPLNVSFKEG